MNFSKNKHYIFIASIIFSILIVCVIIFSVFQNSKVNTRQKEVFHTRVAVINAVKLKETAICFKSHKKIEELQSEIIAKYKKIEQEIKKEYEKIRNDKNISQKQKIKNKAKIESTYSDISTKYQAEMQNVKNMDSKLTEYLSEKLNKAIEKIAKAQKFNIVLNTQSRDTIFVFYNAKNSDITDLVIQKLDEMVPSVNIEEFK